MCTTRDKTESMKYAFRYNGVGGWVLRAMGLGSGFSSIDVSHDIVRVRMGWGFRATIPRANIARAATGQGHPFSRGVHGWRGRWLVNGSGDALVPLTIEPATRARVIGFPIKLRELTVSVDAPSELIEALAVG